MLEYPSSDAHKNSTTDRAPLTLPFEVSVLLDIAENLCCLFFRGDRICRLRYEKTKSAAQTAAAAHRLNQKRAVVPGASMDKGHNRSKYSLHRHHQQQQENEQLLAGADQVPVPAADGLWYSSFCRLAWFCVGSLPSYTFRQRLNV